MYILRKRIIIFSSIYILLLSIILTSRALNIPLFKDLKTNDDIFIKNIIWIGIGVHEVPSNKQNLYKYNQEKNIIIIDIIPNTPAMHAGLKVGDIISYIDGERINNIAQLKKVVTKIPSGKRVPIVIIRNNKKLSLYIQTLKLPLKTASFEKISCQAK